MNSTIEMLAFGQVIEIVGKKAWTMEHAIDTAQLNAILVKHFPALAQAEYRMAVNMEIISGNTELKPGDVVALLPPFSGG